MIKLGGVTLSWHTALSWVSAPQQREGVRILRCVCRSVTLQEKASERIQAVEVGSEDTVSIIVLELQYT